jgi:hypothetical protein
VPSIQVPSIQLPSIQLPPIQVLAVANPYWDSLGRLNGLVQICNKPCATYRVCGMGLGSRPPSHGFALETGRIRNPAWRYSEGNSTYFLMRLPGVKKLVSIDNDSEDFTGLSGTAEFCRKYLSPAQLANVELSDGNSVDVLNKLKLAEPFDFVLLDSANDPALIDDELAAALPLVNRHRACSSPTTSIIRVTKVIVRFRGLFKTADPRYMTAAPGDCCYFVLRDALRLRAAPASSGNETTILRSTSTAFSFKVDPGGISRRRGRNP